MSWWEFAAVVSRPDLDRRITQLFAAGAAGAQEDHLPGEAPVPRQPWDNGPLPAPSDRVLVRAWFETVGPMYGAAFDEGSWKPVADRDWEADGRANFRAEVVSDRITVAPPWDAVPGAIVIDPGIGFGTGGHPTTRAALRAIDRWCDGCHTMLDVGSGSGVLALAAARLGLRARGVDVEAAAVRQARRAARFNALDASFSLVPVGVLRRRADLVVANLHAELIVELASDLRRLARRRIVLAGVLGDREDRVTACFEDLPLLQREVDGEWICQVWGR